MSLVCRRNRFAIGTCAATITDTALTTPRSLTTRQTEASSISATESLRNLSAYVDESGGERLQVKPRIEGRLPIPPQRAGDGKR